MNLLEVRAITVGYGDAVAISEVSLEVAEHEVVVVLGANGAGKSTLLRGIAGSLRLIEGDILFAGRSVAPLKTWSRTRAKLSYVPQGRRCFAGLTVDENLRMGGATVPIPEMNDALVEVYDVFPALAAKRSQDSRELSGGQQQMLAIGRGLIQRPKMLLLDEPSLGLSPKLVDELATTIGVVVERFGMSVLMVEQNLEIAAGCASRGYLLENGRRIADGPVETLVERVASAYLGASS